MTTAPLSEQFPPVLPRRRWRWNGLLIGVGLGFAVMALVFGFAGINPFPGSYRVISTVGLVFLVPALVLQLRLERLIRNMRKADWPVEVIYFDEREPKGYIIQMDGSRATARVKHIYWVPSGEPATGRFREADYKEGSREFGSVMLFYGDRDPATWDGEWPLVCRTW